MSKAKQNGIIAIFKLAITVSETYLMVVSEKIITNKPNKNVKILSLL